MNRAQLVFSLLASAVGAAACHSEPPAAHPAAAASARPAPIARYQAATGGARWEQVAAIATTYTVSTGGLTGTTASVEDVRTGRYKNDTQLGAITEADGFDGTAGWEQSVGGEVVVLDDPAAKALAVTNAWMARRGLFHADATTYRELGARELGARKLHVVEATPPGGAPLELWFDDATGLLAQTTHRQSTETVTARFDDYRPVDGVSLPFKIDTDAGDPRTKAIAVATQMKLGPIADAAYARPRTDLERLSFSNGATATRVPFDLVNNHIYIHGEVDGKPVRFLVDTGGVNLLIPSVAARLGLTVNGKMQGAGVGERKVDMGFARGKTLAVGDVRLADPMFYVIDFEALNDVEGENVEGLVGFEMFHRLAVRIDYPARTLILTSRDHFTAPATPGTIAVPFELRVRIPVVQGAIDGIPARLTIDTGARNAISIHSPFTREHQLEARYHPAFETLTGWGVGGGSKGKPVRLGKLQLGDAVLPDVVGDLFVGDKGAFADPEASGNIGGGVLKRFVVTFDYRDRKMFLEPAAGVPRDVYDRAGMFFLRQRRDAGVQALHVEAVVAGGAADQAGIAVGDSITSIDGAAIASKPLAAWREVLAYGKVGDKHKISVDHAGARAERTLILRELVP